MTNINKIPRTHPRADTEAGMDSGTGMRRDAAGNPQHDTNPSAGGTGRPGMGESALGLVFARAAALRHHMATVVFSSTMSPAELAQRVVSAGTDIPMTTLNHGRHLDDVTEHRTGTPGGIPAIPPGVPHVVTRPWSGGRQSGTRPRARICTLR